MVFFQYIFDPLSTARHDQAGVDDRSRPPGISGDDIEISDYLSRKKL
jgi:hypothetical protein